MLFVNYNHIAVEGIDGSGKSTFVKRLCRELDNEVNTLITDCSPYDKDLTPIIRRLLKNEYGMDKKTLHKSLLNLFTLDNRLHSEDIEKNSMNGDIYLSDRFIGSTLAYQSLNTKMKKIIKMIRKTKTTKVPGLIIFFDVDPKISLARINSRGEEKEIFEKEATLIKVRKNYLDAFEMLKEETKNKCLIISINANRDEESVYKDAYNIFKFYCLFQCGLIEIDEKIYEELNRLNSDDIKFL